MLCYAMLCYAMLGYAMLCYATLCYARLRYDMLCCSMNNTEHLNTTQTLGVKGFRLKRKSPQGDLKQETYRKHPVLLVAVNIFSDQGVDAGAPRHVAQPQDRPGAHNRTLCY